MDINGFGLDSEYFGFGGYKQLPNSNTSFMNFTFEESVEYKTALNKHNSIMEDLVTDADKKAETDRFEKEVRALRLTLGGNKVVAGLQKFGDILNKLGYQPKTADSTTVIQSNTPPPSTEKKFPWVWVITGVVVLGGAAFAIYKLKK